MFYRPRPPRSSSSKRRLSSASFAKATRISPPPRPRRAISTRVPSAARSRSSAARVFASLRAPGRRLARRAQQRDTPFDLAHREPLARGLAAELELVLGAIEGEQGAGVARVEPPLGDQLAQLARQAQQAQRVRDRRALATHAPRDLLLRQVELVLQALEGLRLLERRQLLALDVLDEGQLQQLLVGHVAQRDRHAREPGRLRGAPAPLAGDDLVALAAAPHQDRLHDAALADRRP